MGCSAGTVGWTERPACQNGVDADGDGGVDFDGGVSARGGVAVGPRDAQCNLPYRTSEAPTSCGVGAELAAVLAVLGRRSRARAAISR